MVIESGVSKALDVIDDDKTWVLQALVVGMLLPKADQRINSTIPEKLKRRSNFSSVQSMVEGYDWEH